MSFIFGSLHFFPDASVMAAICDLDRQCIRKVGRLGATPPHQLAPVGLRYDGQPLLAPGHSCVVANRLAPALGGRKVKAQHSLLPIAAAMVAGMLGAGAPGAQEASAILSPQA